MGDRTTFAYLADFFVDEEFRGSRAGTVRLMVAVHGHPELQGLKRWTLKTRDAHRLYERFGYEMVGGEGGFMVRMHRNPTLFSAGRTGRPGGHRQPANTRIPSGGNACNERGRTGGSCR